MIIRIIRNYDEDGFYWTKIGTNDIHREDGPAEEEFDGKKTWKINDRLHREDGPAVIYPNGREEWFNHGKKWTKQRVLVTKRAAEKTLIG